MFCQKCRQPLKLDGSLQDLNPAAYDLLVCEYSRNLGASQGASTYHIYSHGIASKLQTRIKSIDFEIASKRCKPSPKGTLRNRIARRQQPANL